MSRTTIDIDTPVLKDLKRLKRRRGVSLGRLISDLLVKALAREAEVTSVSPPFKWNAKAMGSSGIDIGDKHAIYSALDAELVKKLQR